MTCSPTCLLLLIFMFSQNYLNGQIQIDGIVKNDEKNPIENASVVVYDSINNIIGYSYTDIKGEYSIGIDDVYKNYIFVSAQRLGFKKKTDTLEIKSNLSRYYKSFVLVEKVEQLNEVLLKPTEKISKEGNTITYKVDAFNDGTEQTVEDVLKRLPGIEVLNDGTIKAQGRFIDKLLVEGEDMFDKNYTVLSKNLDASVLKSVEILDEFEDNPVLKKVLKSEKIALNLVLKEGFKNIWFGNVSAGLGTEERIRLASNVGLIRKKIKFFNFNNFNNLGSKANSQIEGAQSSKSNFFREERIQPGINAIYSIQDNNNTVFDEGESTFNKAFINSLSFVTSLRPDLKIRGTTNYTNDIEDQLFSSQTTFNTGNEDAIRYFENSSLRKKNTISGGELELKYFKDDKSYIKNILTYNNQPEKINHNAVFNDNTIKENLTQKEFSFYNHLNYSYLIGEKNVLHSYLYFGKNKINQQSIITSPVLNNFFAQTETSKIIHSSNDDTSVIGAKSSIILNFGKLKSNSVLGYEVLTENRKNEFVLLQSNNQVQFDSLQNDFRFQQKKIVLNTEFEYPLSNNIEFYAELSLDYINLKTRLSNDKVLLFNPRVRLAFKNLKIGYFSFSFSQSYREPRSYLFLENFQLNSFQSFRKGLEEVYFPTDNRLGFYYQINNEMHTKALSLRVQYSFSDGQYSTDNQIGEDIILSSYNFVDTGTTFFGNIDYTSYLKKMNLSTKIGSSQSLSVIPISANNSELNNLKTYRSSYFLTATTYFKFPINFKLQGKINYAMSEFNGAISKARWQTYDVDTTLKLSDVWIATLSNNFYILSNSSYSFTNFKVDFIPEKSRFSYQFVLNNLTNENLYSLIDVDEFSQYRSNIQLLPRYVFALIKYRF